MTQTIKWLKPNNVKHRGFLKCHSATGVAKGGGGGTRVYAPCWSESKKKDYSEQWIHITFPYPLIPYNYFPLKKNQPFKKASAHATTNCRSEIEWWVHFQLTSIYIHVGAQPFISYTQFVVEAKSNLIVQCAVAIGNVHLKIASSGIMVEQCLQCSLMGIQGCVLVHKGAATVKKKNIYIYIYMYIPGVPEKAERWSFSRLRAESVIYFYISRYSIFRRREWYLDHEIWFSNLDSMTISWNTVIFKFRWIFGTDERRILSGQTVHKSSCTVEAHCSSVFLLLPRINGLQQKLHRMEDLFCHNSPLIGRKNPAKFENDRISRNDHRIKITQPNVMI